MVLFDNDDQYFGYNKEKIIAENLKLISSVNSSC